MAATGESYSIARMFILRGTGPTLVPPPLPVRPKRWDAGRIECPECRENTLSIGNGEDPRCASCGFTDSPEDAATAYMEKVLGWSRSDRDGEESPLFPCPDCDRGYTLLSLRSPERLEGHMCFECGVVWRQGVLEVCCECNEPRHLDGEIICNRCMDRKLAED